MESQRCASAIRKISLTPAGITTNYVFDYIIDDIVRGTKEGFEVVDYSGQRATVLLQMLGFVSDYPDSAEVSDVINHNARDPCTVCTFRYKTHHIHKKEYSINKCYTHTTDVNYSGCSHRSGIFITMELRGSRLTETQCIYLGIKKGSKYNISRPGNWPLLKIALKLDCMKRCRHLYSSGGLVIRGKLDPFAANIIAPNHCITGLLDGLINMCFRQIRESTSNVSTNLKFEFVLCQYLKKVGVPGRTSIYNAQNGVHSLSMSTIYAICTLVPHVLRCIGLHGLDCLDLVYQMNRIVAMDFY